MFFLLDHSYQYFKKQKQNTPKLTLLFLTLTSSVVIRAFSPIFPEKKILKDYIQFSPDILFRQIFTLPFSSQLTPIWLWSLHFIKIIKVIILLNLVFSDLPVFGIFHFQPSLLPPSSSRNTISSLVSGIPQYPTSLAVSQSLL